MNKELLNQLTILYVEDQNEIREFTSSILASFVKNVYTAANGLEGVEVFKKYKDEIDLIITDINMPKLNGLDMYKEISELKKNVHAIVTTAHADSSFYQKALNLDIISYTLKPIDLYDIVCNITKLFEINFLRKQITNEKIQDNNEALKEITEKQSSSIALFDKNELIFSNENFKKIFPNSFDLNSLSSDIIDLKDNWYKDLEKLVEIDRVVYKTLNGEKKAYKADIINLDENRFLLSLYDITKLNEKSTLYEYKMNYDLVTGIYNLNKFQKLFNIEQKRATRYRKDLTFILLELASYESDNELNILSTNIDNNIREHDILFKTSDKEFLIMLPETDLDGALNASYKLDEKLQDLIENGEISSNLLFGVTELKSEDTKDLIIAKLQNAVKKSKGNSERINYF